MIADVDIEKLFEKSRPYRIYMCYLELVDLGFDFEKNSAQDLVDCIEYIYNERYGIDVPF